MTRASCLCGAVRVRVEGPLAEPFACHCVQCRKGTGHYDASASAPRAAVTVEGEVRWFEYKPGIRRGFCPVCGSQVLWDRAGSDRIGVQLGIFDDPTGVRLAGHQFVAEKGDYYDLTDGLPQYEGESP